MPRPTFNSQKSFYLESLAWQVNRQLQTTG